jgi:hypothetical protein
MGNQAMTKVKVQYDGRALVPVIPLNIPKGATFDIYLDETPLTALQKLASLAKECAVDDDTRTDGAAQHDHYLYGTPKRS